MSASFDEFSRGGGMGRYAGLTLPQIADRFAACEDEPSMRSVSAVLRITREQLEARGHLGDYPKIGVATAVVAILLGVATLAIPDHAEQIRYGALGFAAVTLAVGFGLWSTRVERKAGRVQERQIRQLAADTLQRLLVYDFARKPLLREQEQTLRDLLRREPRQGLETLLHKE